MSGAAKDAPVRLGVIGVGIMGSNHARVLADLSGVHVVGIADPGASHRALLAQIVGCAACDDVDELLGLGIDAAVIAAPTHLHHDIALTCIKRACMCWSRSRSPPMSRKAARSSRRPSAPA